MRANGRSSEGGFTIVELLVVLIICAILMAIILPSLGKTRQNTGGPTVNVAAAAIWRGVQNYRIDNSGTFPPIGMLQNGGATFKDPGQVKYVKRWPENTKGQPMTVVNGSGNPTTQGAQPGQVVYFQNGNTGYLIGYSDRGTVVFRREAGNWNSRPAG